MNIIIAVFLNLFYRDVRISKFRYSEVLLSTKLVCMSQ